MFKFKKKDKKNKASETKVELPADHVWFIKRIDVKSDSYSSGDGEYSSSDTYKYDALDIVKQYDNYYLIRSETYYNSSYDRYESPMNTSSERSSFTLCPISEDMLEYTKEQLEKYMQESKGFSGSCQDAPSYSAPSEHFVCKYARKVIDDHQAQLREAENKKNGGAKHNAIWIPAVGKADAIYIDDFSSRGLARALGCDEVKIFTWDKEPSIAYFYDKKIVYGRAYNELASSIFGVALEGIVMACACDEKGSCKPLDEKSANLIAGLCNVKKKFM